MGILDGLFGIKKLTLQDDLLGEFESLRVKDNEVRWEGEIEFFGAEVSVVISGTKNALDAAEKELVLSALVNQPIIETEVNKALREQYENADEEYSTWSEHFNCASISVSGEELEISFEEKKSQYLFNVHFINNVATGVSIDS